LQPKDHAARAGATRKVPRSLELEPTSRRQASNRGCVGKVRPDPAQDISVSKGRDGQQHHVGVGDHFRRI
jgi:hypothetical protein